MLKLTSKGLQNIKNQTHITKEHLYSNVTKVSLAAIDRFVIEYDNDHPFRYCAENAMEIVQEIESRLHCQHQTAKKKLKEEIALNYQQSLDEHTERNRSYSVDSVAASLRLRDSLKMSNEEMNLLRQSTASLQTFEELSTSMIEKPRALHHVRMLLCNKRSSERRTIDHFIKTFRILEKNISTACLNTRQFLDGMRLFIWESRHEELMKYVLPTQKNGPESIQRIIENELEGLVIESLYGRLLKTLDSPQCQEDDAHCVQCMKELSCMHQLGYGISESILSSTQWSAAVVELGCVAQRATASQVLGCHPSLCQSHL